MRVLGADNVQLGVLSRDEALKKAKEMNLDLVLIAENAEPPVARIVNLGKYIYQEEKKLKKGKTKSTELKEIRFSPFIGQADYETRLKRVKEFLENKDKVKLTGVLMGRQMNSKSFGFGLLDKVVVELGDTIHIDTQPKFLGRYLSMIVSPKTKKTVKQNAKTKNKEITSEKI
ncbi:translation initiation factor IF-3 [soil metagenome]